MAVEVLRRSESNVEWQPVELRDDQTPPGHGPGEKAMVYESPDGKVVMYFWRRSADIGVLNGGAKPTDRGTKFDVILDGEVEVVDSDGVTHHAKAGDVLAYQASDTGRWEQPGPIEKIAILIRD